MTHPAISTSYGGYCPDCKTKVSRFGARCRPCHAKSMAGRPAPDSCVVSAASAKRGSDALLRRHLELGMHWIKDQAQFDAAVESVRS